MKKVIITLMMFFAAMNVAEAKQNNDGINISSIHSSIQNSSEPRSETISADITGNTLTITFNENVGIAHIVIKDSNGVYIDNDNVFSTPNYATFIIDDAGYYRMKMTINTVHIFV